MPAPNPSGRVFEVPSSTPIPDAAVEALASVRYPGWAESVEGEAKDTIRRIIADELEAAAPHLLAVFREHLLGDEAVIASAKRRHPFLATYIPAKQQAALVDAKRDLEAALSEVVG